MTNIPLQVHIGGTLKEMGDQFIRLGMRVETGRAPGTAFVV